MEKLLLFDFDKCTGCKTCETVCSLVQTGICNPATSRRRTIHFDEGILDVSMQCQQCDEPACMNICPAEAIYVDEETGAKVINYVKCIGCKMCSIACPFGSIFLDPLTKQLIKCDLCSGDPACAKSCPTGALKYITARAYDLTRQRERITQMKRISGGGA